MIGIFISPLCLGLCFSPWFHMTHIDDPVTKRRISYKDYLICKEQSEISSYSYQEFGSCSFTTNSQLNLKSHFLMSFRYIPHELRYYNRFTSDTQLCDGTQKGDNTSYPGFQFRIIIQHLVTCTSKNHPATNGRKCWQLSTKDFY